MGKVWGTCSNADAKELMRLKVKVESSNFSVASQSEFN